MSRRWRTTWRIVLGALMVLPLAIVLPVWVASYAWKGGFVYKFDNGESLVVYDGQFIRLGRTASSMVSNSANTLINYRQQVGQQANLQSMTLAINSNSGSISLTTRKTIGFAEAAGGLVGDYGQFSIPWLRQDIPNFGMHSYSLTFLLIAVGILPLIVFIKSGVHDIRRLRWSASNRCIQCGYARTGLASDSCPECGFDFADPPPRNGVPILFGTRRALRASAKRWGFAEFDMAIFGTA